MTLAELRTDLVIIACAISAGIHAALTPEHFREGTGAGVGFVVATLVLALLAVVLTRNPSQIVLAATAAVFVGLIVSYVLVIAIGLPVVHPNVEAVDGLALFAKAVEAIGLVTAASLVRRPSLLALFQPKGTPT